MSSKLTYASLFAVAALNLSVFTPPTPAQWSESSLASRSPAQATCSQLGQQLSAGRSEVTCAVEATKDTQAVRTDIRVKKQGDGDQANYIVDFTTDAGCNTCKIRGLQTTDQLILNASDFQNINSHINSKRSQLESDAFDQLQEEINKKQAIENCRIDKRGNKLDADEKLQCRLDRLEKMDDEDEATKYFNKHIKKALQEQALSSDPEVREAALEKLSAIGEMDISDSLKQQLSVMGQASQAMANIEAVKQKALLQAQIASNLPDGAQKQQMLQSAHQMLEQQQTQLQNSKIQALMSQSNGGSAAMIQEVNNFYSKAEISLSEVYATSPELQKLKADTLTNGTASGQGRLARGGSQVQLQTTIPQAPNPTGLPATGVIPMDNGNFNNVPGVNMNNGRGTMGSRIPAPQFMQAQPIQNYNSNFPLGNQFQTAPQVMAPMM